MTATQLDDEPARASDALSLQDLSTEATAVHAPWGEARPRKLIRIMDAFAREAIEAMAAGSGPPGLPADRQQGSTKRLAFSFNPANLNLMTGTSALTLKFDQGFDAIYARVVDPTVLVTGSVTSITPPADHVAPQLYEAPGGAGHAIL